MKGKRKRKKNVRIDSFTRTPGSQRPFKKAVGGATASIIGNKKRF